jgi:hypothetical protein
VASLGAVILGIWSFDWTWFVVAAAAATTTVGTLLGQIRDARALRPAGGRIVQDPWHGRRQTSKIDGTICGSGSRLTHPSLRRRTVMSIERRAFARPLDDAPERRTPGLGEHHQQPTTGLWRYELATGQWWWSEETFRLHGFEPHEVVPTTALVLAHKHPEDREAFRRLLDSAKVTGAPFHSIHRILDARSHERVVVVVGQGRRDPATGEVAELMGYLLDATRKVGDRAEVMAGDHIRAAAAHRGVIEQAKGILSVTHGLTIDQAFETLRTTSNQRNVPVRVLAERLVNLGRVLPLDEHRRHCVDEFLRNPL